MKQKNSRINSAILVAMLLASVGILVIAPVEAKYTFTFAGHSAMYYPNSDITPSLRPYIDHLEYDTVSRPGVGARLYFTNAGKLKAAIPYDPTARSMARYIMCMPEWTPQRSENSVTQEIAWHARAPGRYQVDMEYFYADLTSWYDIMWKNI